MHIVVTGPCKFRLCVTVNQQPQICQAKEICPYLICQLILYPLRINYFYHIAQRKVKDYVCLQAVQQFLCGYSQVASYISMQVVGRSQVVAQCKEQQLPRQLGLHNNVKYLQKKTASAYVNMSSIPFSCFDLAFDFVNSSLNYLVHKNLPLF